MNLFKTILLFVALALSSVSFAASPSVSRFNSTSVTIDSAPDRKVPVILMVPEKRRCCPQVRGVILFSHGAFSSPEKYTALTERWARAGYAVVAPLHADSEAWTGAKPNQFESLRWRIDDMKAALGNLALFGKTVNFELTGRPVIIAGHSFGGLIAQLVNDPRIAGAMAFSPPGPLPGAPAPPVAKPLLTVTGTADIVPMMAPKWEDHLAAHKAATGSAIAYIGKDADHYFGRIIGRTEFQKPPQADQFGEAVTVSLLFLRSIVDGDGKGRRALAGYKPKHGVMERR